MKKTLLLAALLCAALGAVSAQNRLPDLEKYAELFTAQFLPADTDWKKAGVVDTVPAVNEKYAILGGNTAYLDTALEIALYQCYSENTNPVPPDAEAILSRDNPRLVDRQLGAMVVKELAEIKFLDPKNTAAAGRYEGMIKFITGRNGVSRAEMQDYLKQGIAAVVREKFNSIEFRLEKYQKSYAATLRIDSKTREYILNYGVYDRNEKKISGRNLEALLDVMKSNTDFDARSIEQVKVEAGLIPAVVYGEWLSKGQTRVDAVKLAADTVAGFYLNPTQENYNLLASSLLRFPLRGIVKKNTIW
jgi:hypothetical protein